MPFVPSKIQGDVPSEPHLAVRMGNGQGFPIPVGAQVMVVVDPKNPLGVQPLLLVKVTSDKLVFRCTCNPRCKQVINMPFVRNGGHNLER